MNYGLSMWLAASEARGMVTVAYAEWLRDKSDVDLLLLEFGTRGEGASYNMIVDELKRRIERVSAV